MSVVIPGAFVLSLFFLGAWAIFSTLIDATNDQSESLRVAGQVHAERARTFITITGMGDSGDGYAMTVRNDSDMASFGDFAKVDLFAHYKDATGNTRTSRLVNPTNWTVTKISGDAVNRDMWDPGETATISFTPSPNLQSCTLGTAVLAVPGGATDTAYFGSTPLCFFWHNDPTPPVGATVSHLVLSMDGSTPTAGTLFNYDTNRDTDAGLLIVKGGVNAAESDPTRHQAWRTASLGTDLLISGTVDIDFWSALLNFKLNSTGRVRIFLRDRTPSGSYTEIGNGQLQSANWQGGTADFVQKRLSITGLNYTVVAGNTLESKVVVHPGSSENMWFAYDTTTHKSVVLFP